MENFEVTLWSLSVLLRSRDVQGSVPALCSAASGLKVRPAEQNTGTGLRVCLWKGAGQLFGPVECVWWLNLWKHLQPPVFEAETQGISPAERCRAGLGAAVFLCISYLGSLWWHRFLKSIALGFQFFVCCVLCVHQRTLLQYCVSTGSNIWHWCFPSWFFGLVLLTQDQKPQLTVNSQVALDDTAERKTVHVKQAYVMECVEAETGRHGEKRHLTEAEQRGKERDN